MRVEVIRGKELDDRLAAEWSAIQRSDPELGNPFLCPQFTRIVASIRRGVFIAVLEEAGRIVGFFPFQRRLPGSGRPVGAPLSDYQAVIIPPGVPWDAKDLLRQCGLRRWTFDHLGGAQPPLEPYRSYSDRYLFLDLSAGYPAYVSARRAAGTEQIKKVAGLARKLEREAGTIRFRAREVDREALRELFRWKSEQYVRSGLIDAFRFRWIVRFFRRLMESHDEDFAGMLSTLSVGGRLIAAQFGLRSRRSWHYWIPAYDREFARFSPGNILLLKMAEAAPDLGIERITLGYDDADYKRRFASGSRPMAAGRVELSPSLTSFEKKVEKVLRSAIIRLPIPARRVADERLDRLKIWWKFH